MKNQELINHDNDDRDGYPAEAPGKERWMGIVETNKVGHVLLHLSHI